MASTVPTTINASASPERVWGFLNALANWPQWAMHNVCRAAPGRRRANRQKAI